MAQKISVAPEVQVHTNVVWHMQPPKLVEGDPATRLHNWENYKKNWLLFEKSGLLGKKSNAQKAAVFLLQAGAEARRHIRDIDPEEALKSVEEVMRALDKLFLPRRNFVVSQQKEKCSDACHNSGRQETERRFCKSSSSMRNRDGPESTGKNPKTLLKIQQQGK